MNGNDKLDQIFFHQGEVTLAIQNKQSALGVEILPVALWGELDNPRTAKEITANIGFCIEELVEALRELPARKPWKADPAPAEWDKFRTEMGDALAFFVEACIFAGIGPNDLAAGFAGVSRKNLERAATNEY